MFVKIIEMASKVILTIGEQIDRAKEGRTQTFIIAKMNDLARAKKIDWSIDDSKFSRKKLGHEEFSTIDLELLSEVLGTEITMS